MSPTVLPKTLLVATTNPGKLKEYQEMFADLGVTWKSLADVGLDGHEVAETGETFRDNALLKAVAYAHQSGLPTLADDSGLVVDAIHGAPGVYSARYAPTAPERNTKLLLALEGVPPEQRSARFVCVIACVFPHGVTILSEGNLEGQIGFAPRGSNGFGYDPVVVLADGRTVAELPPAEKNQISHRGQALIKLRPLLECLFR
ncbi:MAG: RdgB/HAM1 family non-canonical purine NTP pyrophosphatase [Anaerolineae bacterium]|nr:RdgB/HAM1 family non-canonical purine NTP pyrophosphatase [Anaerolineae bacterium]